MVNTTASDAGISGMIGNYYTKVFEARLEANLVFDKWGEQRPIPKNSGNTIVWHQLNNVAVGYNISDGDTPAASAVSARKISAILAYMGDLKSITDQVDMTAVCPVVKETVDALGYGGALTLDQYVADKVGFGSACSTGVANAASATYPSIYSQGFPVMEGNTNAVYWPSAGNGKTVSLQNGLFSTITTIDHVRQAVTQLKALDVMPFDDGLFRGILDPLISDHLRRDSDFATWMQFKYPERMEKGELGVIEKVRFQESTKGLKSPVLPSTWSTTYASLGGSILGTFIFGRGAYGVTKLGGNDVEVNVIPTTQKDKSDPLGQRAYVSYKMAIGAAILNPSCGVILGYYKAN
jgi:N4-gp56 family major capsid protein